LQGLEDDLNLALERQGSSSSEAGSQDEVEVRPQQKERSVQAETVASEPEERGEDPQKILEQLMQRDPRASKEDYYDREADEWDMEGLASDLRVAEERAPEVDSPPDDKAPQGMLVKLISLDPEVTREDYFDEESKEWDLHGLEEDLNLAMEKQGSLSSEAGAQDEVEVPQQKKHSVQAETTAGKPEERGEDPQKMLEQLMQRKPQVSKDDYYDPEADEWDMEGLTADLRIAEERTPEVDSPEGKDPEGMLAKLVSLDPEVTREDYFDEESKEWDVHGLEEDLNLALEKQRSLSEAGPQERTPEVDSPPEGKDPEGMFAKLVSLDPEVTRLDYFDEELKEWDLQGLEDDLNLALERQGSSSSEAGSQDEVEVRPQQKERSVQAETVASEPEERGEDPQKILEQLMQRDPRASKEDYYDREADEWDMEGLASDLRVAEERAPEVDSPPDDKAPQGMLVKLISLDPEVTREDYFDEESKEWDLHGLEEDLNLAMEKQGSLSSEAGAQDEVEVPQQKKHSVQAETTAGKPEERGEDPQKMLEQLMQRKPQVSKDDYYDPEADEWDMEGLTADLRIAEERTPEVDSPEGKDPEGMLAKLVSLDPEVTREDYFDEESKEWDVHGLEEDLNLALEKQGSLPSETGAQEPPAGGEDPESLWVELSRLDSAASKEDYFDPESEEWDLEGLQDDLALAQKNEGAPMGVSMSEASTAEPVPAGDVHPDALMAELVRLDTSVSKEDYFDEESGEWDLEGLREDLNLAKTTEASTPEAARAGDEHPDSMIAELLRLDPRVSKEDYYDEESDEWDLEGLREDLQLAKSAEAARAGDEHPDSMMAELLRLDPRVSKEDYYDEESDEWDLEGLREDLQLAKTVEVGGEGPRAEATASAANAEPTAPVPAEAKVENRPVNISVGDLVLAKYEEDGWYTATVQRDNGNNSFQLKWDEDDTESAVTRDFIRLLPPITEGARVVAVWEEDGHWYDAVVQKVNADGSFVVKYDEDDSEATLQKAKIRTHLEPPREPEYWFAPYREGDAPPALQERVSALWKDGDYEGYHGAVVQKDNGDGTFLVKWDEYDSESPVKREELRKSVPKISSSELSAGQKLTGIVTNTTEFGAFVDFGAERDGFVRKTKLRNSYVSNVEDVVAVGQQVDVWFCGVSDNKITLSMVEDRCSSGPPSRQTVTNGRGRRGL